MKTRPETSFVSRLAALAEQDPQAKVVTGPTGHMNRGELEHQSNALAQALLHNGVMQGEHVVILLPNDTVFVAALVAVWKVGAIPTPLNAKLPTNELLAAINLTQPRVVIADSDREVTEETHLLRTDLAIDNFPIAIPDNLISPSWKAIGSGGSTGSPKIILTPAPAALEYQNLNDGPMRIHPEETSVITAPLSHNGPFVALVQTLLQGGHAVLMGRFDAEKTLETVEKFKATWLYMVPTMMSRISKLDDTVRNQYDVSSLTQIVHMGAPCPGWLKQRWIEWLGPEKIVELYTSTEAIVIFSATGQEWLNHPGTVGKPHNGSVEIRDTDGNLLPVGEPGYIWLKNHKSTNSYTYLGTNDSQDSSGWRTLGDIGCVDDDGYLYIRDRDSDLILVGGSNVYPAEIEGALLGHPAVSDAAVIGLPDDDLGQVPHALVQTNTTTTEHELLSYLSGMLAMYKRPRSWEFVSSPLRDEAGKINRRKLQKQRIPHDNTSY